MAVVRVVSVELKREAVPFQIGQDILEGRLIFGDPGNIDQEIPHKIELRLRLLGTSGAGQDTEDKDEPEGHGGRHSVFH
jgi:hypothetical protein